MRQRMPATPLFNSSGVPTKAFQALLDLTGIRETDPQAIRKLTQTAWLKQGKLSVQIEEENAHLAREAAPIFDSLRLTGVPRLQSDSFQWCVVLGATYVAMHKRIAHAASVWNEGKRWTNTAYLGSYRPLLADKESESIITKPVEGGLPFRLDWEAPKELPQNEGHLFAYILHQVRGNFPRNPGREANVIAGNRPNGSPAGTKETLESFVSMNDPRGTSCLIVSSQPFVLRAQIEATQILGDRFEIVEATGYGVEGTMNVTKTLHELAKIVFDLVDPE